MVRASVNWYGQAHGWEGMCGQARASVVVMISPPQLTLFPAHLTPFPLQDAGQGPLGAAYGSRSHLEKGFMAKRSALRNFLTRGFHVCVTLVAGGRIRDTQCGFKVRGRGGRGR